MGQHKGDAADAVSYLARLRDCATPEDRAALAELGLAAPGLSVDLELLLLRARYRARLEQGRLEDALEDAQRMTKLAVAAGQLRDVAHHDCARALAALGQTDQAIEQQQLAVYQAVPSQRSFHLWSLAILQHFAHYHDAAIRTLERGLSFAQRDRLLIQAHIALIQLEQGETPADLHGLLESLKRTASAGYVSYLRGMIAHQLGDLTVARVCLTAWVKRQQARDRAHQVTLQEELRRAQQVLATMASHSPASSS